MSMMKDQIKIEEYRKEALNFYKKELDKLDKMILMMKDKDFTNCEGCRELDSCIKSKILGNCKLWNM